MATSSSLPIPGANALEIGPSGRRSSDPMCFAALSVTTVGEPGVLWLGSDPAPGRSRHSRPWPPSALAQVFPWWKGLSSPPACQAAGELTDGEERETAAGPAGVRWDRSPPRTVAPGDRQGAAGREEPGRGGAARVCAACGVQSGPARSYIRSPVGAGDTEPVL